MTLMVIVTLAVIVVEGRLLLPTESDFFSVFPVAVIGVDGGTVTLSSSVLPLTLLHRCCCLCCYVVVVIVVERRYYLGCFRFSISSLLLLSSSLFFSCSLFSRCRHRFAPLSFGLVASPLL